MTALSDLRARVLAGSGEGLGLSYDILEALGHNSDAYPWDEDLLSDLNAVIALVEENLPQWVWHVGIDYELPGYANLFCALPVSGASPVRVSAQAPSPARALLAALLEAMETPDDNA